MVCVITIIPDVFLEGVDSVSYTHLDVYKRQAVGSQYSTHFSEYSLSWVAAGVINGCFVSFNIMFPELIFPEISLKLGSMICYNGRRFSHFWYKLG